MHTYVRLKGRHGQQIIRKPCAVFDDSDQIIADQAGLSYPGAFSDYGRQVKRG